LQHVPWIHIGDAVESLASALEDDRYRGPYNAVAPGAIPQGTFARALGRALGRPAFVPVPGWLLRMAIGGAAETVLAGQRAVPRRLAELGFRFRFETIDAALAAALSAPPLAPAGQPPAHLDGPG
jgi:NAD dependent epimerase/dehydratase family enzyme